MRFEQRKNNRVVLSISVRYKIFKLEKLEEDIRDMQLNQEAKVEDLSLGGSQITSLTPFQKGEILEMEMDIPGRGVLRTVAKIIWCEKNEANRDGEFHSGIQFIPVYEEDLKQLNQYFSGLN